jgi:protein-tyrosine phosphatase
VFWWIEEGVLAGCHNPDDGELSGMIARGFATVVSLLEEDRQPPGYGPGHFQDGDCVRVSIPVPDFGVPAAEQARRFLEAVRDGLDRGMVLVHCQGGSGRTGTMGAIWLMESAGLDPAGAIREVRRRNPAAVETSGQEEFLAGWHRSGHVMP